MQPSSKFGVKPTRENISSAQTGNSLFPETAISLSSTETKQRKTTQWIVLLPLDLIRDLFSRIVGQEEKINYIKCHTLLSLGSTCWEIKKNVDEYLMQFTELCLKNKLENNIFSEREREVISTSELGSNIEKGVHYDHHDTVLLFFVSKYSDCSAICKQFQQVFEVWNFDLSGDPSEEVRIIIKCRAALLEELIKRGYIENPEYALCVIKKLIIGYLDTPGDRFHTTVAYETYSLLEKLIKNATPFECTFITYIDKGVEYTVEPEFDRLVKRTITIPSDCINWIVVKSNDCLDVCNNPKNAKKVFELFILLVKNDVIVTGSQHIESILKQTIKWLDLCYKKDGFEELECRCLEFLTVLVEKGIGSKIFEFLDVRHIINFTGNIWVEGFLKTLAKNGILSKNIEFTQRLMDEAMKLLDDEIPYYIINVLLILSDNKILVNYSECHELITIRAIDWLSQEDKPIRSTMLINSLIKNKILILNPGRTVRIAQKVGGFLAKNYWRTTSDLDYLIKSTLSIINELLKSRGLFSIKYVNELRENVTKKSFTRAFCEGEEGKKRHEEVQKLLSRLNEIEFSPSGVDSDSEDKEHQRAQHITIKPNDVSIKTSQTILIQSLRSYPAIMFYICFILIVLKTVYNDA